jgi:hypothetical protein
LRIKSKQPTDKQKDGEQTPHADVFIRKRGSFYRLIPLTAEGVTVSGGSYEPRDRHKQYSMVFMVLFIDCANSMNLTDFVKINIPLLQCHFEWGKSPLATKDYARSG